MPTTIYTATANATPFAWLIVGAASAWQAVNTSNDGTSYIEDDNSSSTLSNTLTGLTPSVAVPDGAAFDSVSFTQRSQRSAASPGQIRYEYTLGGTTVNATYRGPGSGWTTFVDDITSLRPGGGTWVKGDFTTLITRFRGDGTGSAGVMLQVTYFDYTVVFRPPAGGFAFLIGSLVGASLGAHLLLRDVEAIARAVRGSVLLSREEVLTAWQELREDRHPRTFDLGCSARA